MTLFSQVEVVLFLRGLQGLAGVVAGLWGVSRLAPMLTPMALALPSLCGTLLALPVAAVRKALLHDLHAQDRQSGLYAGETSTFLALLLHIPAKL
ncbi:hypothetical protein [Xanthomonas sp. MUS 060]|uniref:hypothetical protein n=1 Tax=Xanthomonas sp. MUS 060 TaxID=1588031 RepID=UPI000AD3FFB7|nr:hypothetical protein [Xanthomonas sp. MUS 060]